MPKTDAGPLTPSDLRFSLGMRKSCTTMVQHCASFAAMSNRRKIKARQIRGARASSRAKQGFIPDSGGREIHWADAAEQVYGWRKAIDRHEPGVVVAAREEGASWTEIGRAVGQSAAQLRRRYGP